MDWIIGTLDALTRRATGAGNASQIIVELEGHLDAPTLREAASAFASRFPALSGKPARDFLNLAPYWRMDRPVGHCAVELLPAQPDTAAATAALCRALNSPFPTARDHLAFRLVHAGPDRTCLGMVFDHRLFDARGAELFLDRLAAFAAGDTSPSPKNITHPVREPYLTDWSAKFASGRNVNRAIRTCAAARPATLPLPPGRAPFQYHFQPLDLDQSARITETAFALGGYLVKLPWLLALALQAVDRLFASRGLASEHYVIPVSIDRRAARADSQSLFFNHIAFLYFIISRPDLDSPQALVQSITRQMYEQTKSRLAHDFEQTMMLMRILPVGALAAFSQRLFHGNFGSFVFSYLGETACRARSILGHRVLNLFHTPRVSTPPGLGIFLNECDARINVTAASLANLLTPDETAALARHFLPDSPA